MDPRHPELAVGRIRELMSQYDKIKHDIEGATTSSRLSQLERQGGLVVQEICLVAPRLHEAMIQVSRKRRHELSHPITAEMLQPAMQEIIEKYIEDAVEQYTAPNQAETVIVEPKPRKKKSKKGKK